MYTTPGEDSGLGSESRSPGCTPILERTVGSVRRVALRDVHQSWRGQWAQFGESLSGMYTTPGEIVGSTGRVGSGDVHHSWRGLWAQFGESLSADPGCTPLLERTMDSVRRVALRDVHRSWRGQWAQFGESLIGIYTTPGEDSAINRENWFWGCTPLPERIVGSTGRVGSGDVHHSWRGQRAQFGESLSGMYTAPGEDSWIIRENLWNTHQSGWRLGSTRTVFFEDTHHSWWRFSFGINTAFAGHLLYRWGLTHFHKNATTTTTKLQCEVQASTRTEKGETSRCPRPVSLLLAHVPGRNERTSSSRLQTASTSAISRL